MILLQKKTNYIPRIDNQTKKIHIFAYKEQKAIKWNHEKTQTKVCFDKNINQKESTILLN